MNKTFPLLLTILAVAFLAALAEQVQHEATHGLAALLVGAKWESLNLFAVATSWPGAMNTTGELIIAGSAAVLNIVVGFVSIFLLGQPMFNQRPLLKYFVMCFAAYSLFAGFGYLLVDSAFYRPGDNLGDWKQVIALLGGSWGIRAPLLMVGIGGTIWTLLWLARAGLEFIPNVSDKAARRQGAIRLLLVPYIGVNLIFTALSFWHPVGPEGVIIALLKYWFGYIGFFWAFFIIGFTQSWQRAKLAAPATPLPDTANKGWIIAACIGLAIAALVLLPTVKFN